MAPTVDIVARNIRAYAGYAGLNSTTLSRVLKTHKSNVNHKFKGARKWSFDDLDLLAELFGIEPYEFLMEKPDISRINADEVKERVPRLGFEPRTNGL